MCHLTLFRSIVRYPELRGDLIHSSAKLAEFLIALSVGYFFYDGFDLLLFGTLQRAWPVLLHHGLTSLDGDGFISLPSLPFLLYAVRGASPAGGGEQRVPAWEATAPHGGDREVVGHLPVVGGANLVSFVVLRFGLITYFFAFMFVNRSILYTRALEFMVPLMAAMAVINVILFWRLLKSDVFQSKNGQNQREVLVSN
ncbi:hypothetical protein BSL78_19674 [Apostichopus japonicus]|uniref:TLC domain-containing protein n=1 Tax=Stichopus japonicus TaxID=307972 RepID=A0A2G8K632_STIJA|nr:hypothetical protein BSL78_19674 [Apostichopus japonicus]